MLNVKTWWAVIRSMAVPRPAGELSAATRDAEQQYCWLLPGDVPYCPAPSPLGPKAADD